MTPAEGGSRALGSLRGQLLRRLLLPLLLLWAISTISAYREAADAATLAYDRTLLASARVIAERLSGREGKVIVDLPWVALDTFMLDTSDRVYYRVSGIGGEFVSGYADFPPPPAGLRRSELYPALAGFYDGRYRGVELRIAALHQPVAEGGVQGMALVQVGETLQARQALARRILLSTVWRQGLLVLCGAVLIVLAVRGALSPLERIRRAVDTREPGDAGRFDEAGVHREVRPLVVALNAYTERLLALLASRRRFIADASHQLRTPLAVLKTQTQHALREDSPALWRETLCAVQRSVDQMTRLSNQLLSLARAESGAVAAGLGPRAAVDVVERARELCLERAPFAVGRRIDLALETPDTALDVDGDATLLHEMLANLLDNALRYVPAGSRVTLRVHAEAARVVIEVLDDGPGIAAEERERVFGRFYRVPGTQAEGSGLGLAIVRDIARSHGGEVTLGAGLDGRGLGARVELPRAGAGRGGGVSGQ
ncbi:two-component system sensor histidine kinase TctE [Plasticicumulans lactativorans]|uniref:histidine kinase n=1 Tax=Plasticicumulans lactativorans TaxID=1133106 RepID=A0A4R2LM10_9GAMM|nr:sensor histidine kinase [Plasticicumulans lactativorans]TCO80475.1 two-component system sensor histidine kinase TctE [Plasticicumulans lactativorans]